MLLRDGHAGPKVDYVMELLYITLLLGGVLMLLKLGGQDVALLLQLAYPAVYVLHGQLRTVGKGGYKVGYLVIQFCYGDFLVLRLVVLFFALLNHQFLMPRYMGEYLPLNCFLHFMHANGRRIAAQPGVHCA